MVQIKERSLVIVKPDGIQRGLIGEVIKRYERSGLKLVGLKMLIPTTELAEKHYLIDPEWLVKVGNKAIEAYEKKGMEVPNKNPEDAGRRVLEGLKKYFTCSVAVAMVWEGVGAVAVVRKITGSTEPASSDVGTIRGDFMIDNYLLADAQSRALRNVVHASGSVSDAEKEIELWFKKEELFNYRLVTEGMIYDVNLDGILE